jgi:hypothetical protein
MHTLRLGWTTVGLVSLAIVAATGTRAFGHEIQVVSPSAVANLEGNRSVTPAPGTLRIQFLYPASDFAGLPESHRLIAAFNYRADRTQTQPVDYTFPNDQVWMSTTDKDSLTRVFDDNHGPNKTLVHDGTMSFPVLGTGPPQGPRDFADGTRLQTPFFYDPSQGNLLVERLVFADSIPVPSPTLDTQSTAEARVLATNVGFPNTPTGILQNEGPATQFEFVPEPSAFVLTGLALVCLLAWRRKILGLVGK